MLVYLRRTVRCVLNCYPHTLMYSAVTKYADDAVLFCKFPWVHFVNDELNRLSVWLRQGGQGALAPQDWLCHSCAPK